MTSFWIATYSPGCDCAHSLRCCSNTLSSAAKGPVVAIEVPPSFILQLLSAINAKSRYCVIALLHYNVIMQQCEALNRMQAYRYSHPRPRLKFKIKRCQRNESLRSSSASRYSDTCNPRC